MRILGWNVLAVALVAAVVALLGLAFFAALGDGSGLGCSIVRLLQGEESS
jgi:hypothetical protein